MAILSLSWSQEGDFYFNDCQLRPKGLDWNS